MGAAESILCQAAAALVNTEDMLELPVDILCFPLGLDTSPRDVVLLPYIACHSTDACSMVRINLLARPETDSERTCYFVDNGTIVTRNEYRLLARERPGSRRTVESAPGVSLEEKCSASETLTLFVILDFPSRRMQQSVSQCHNELPHATP